jgi:K+-sensing histidine kinase KdpD
VQRSWIKYAVAVVTSVVSVALLIDIRAHVNLTTVALLLILVVTSMATWAGRGPALLTSVLTLFAFNYYFIPPLHTFNIGHPQNWVAFAVFVICALLVGELSSLVKKKAEEAESRRVKIEELYRELQGAFEQASEAETLRRSEKLKTALLDAVTHDLRTPLTSIKASVTALLDESNPASEMDREFLQVINEETDHLNRFVEEMMSLAQIEGGHLLLRRTPTSAEDIVNNAVDRAVTAKTPVEITIEDQLPLLSVDAATISQALYEILENAVKYSPTGGRIRVQAARHENSSAQFAVENEGVPIPEQYRERVFEKFFRVQGSRKGHGFGMGLAIARGIVEAHGGKIWIDSGRNGRGTVVRFTIPCEHEA